MKPAPNPRYAAFLAELTALRRPFSHCKGLLFRASCLPYAQTTKLLDGKGSLSHGGRWSAAGTFSAVNLSTAQETAIAESGASFTYYNFAPSDVRPKIIVAVRASFSKVLDLVAPSHRGQIAEFVRLRSAGRAGSAAEVAGQNLDSVVFFEVGWKVVDTESGRQLYQVTMPNKVGDDQGNSKELVSGAPAYLPVFVTLNQQL